MPSNEARSTYSTLVQNLRSIQEWIREHENLPEMTNNDEFMSFSVEIMNKSLYLLRVGVSLTDQKSSSQGVTRNRAIVLAHVVRLMKLYECFVMHACERRAEICMIFFRLILETAIRLEYLVQAKNTSFKSFVLTSYRPEKENLRDLKGKARKDR